MNKLNFTSKSNGDILNASEWNSLVEKTDELVQAINDGGGSGSSSSTPVAIDASGTVTVNSKGNTTISATKHINIEPAYVANGGAGTYGDVQIKPGDDITLESHHRASDKRDEITVKTSNGQDGASKAPVKLQVIAADMTLSTKGKLVGSGSSDSSNVMNVNVTTGSGKGYLKVRAQAIDLRCEEHGGIALQPKGEDGSGNENKIKFEHGGGDGLEFGTFNTEKTSIFTDEYRFNKDGVWKMATRQKTASDKADLSDSTTAYKYVKQADDFYDVIDSNDNQVTTENIIKTAYALNGAPGIHSKFTSKQNLEIAGDMFYEYLGFSTSGDGDPDPRELNTTSITPAYTIDVDELDDPVTFNVLTIKDDPRVKKIVYPGYNPEDPLEVLDPYLYVLSKDDMAQVTGFDADPVALLDETHIGDGDIILFNNVIDTSREVLVGIGPHKLSAYFKVHIPNINLEGLGDIKLDAYKNIDIKAANKLSLKGILDFGSSFQFGETDEGIEVQNKYTKKGALKDCGKLKVIAVNNNSSAYTFNTLWDPTANSNAGESIAETTVSVPAGESVQIAEASIYDIIKLVNYMKDNNEGPWAGNL